MNPLVMFILFAVLINVGSVTAFYILEDIGVLEWEVIYAVPLGIVNGIILLIYNVRKAKSKQKELNELR